jgi:hypothetical protein
MLVLAFDIHGIMIDPYSIVEHRRRTVHSAKITIELVPAAGNLSSYSFSPCITLNRKMSGRE